MQAGLLRDKITIERSDVTHNTENGEQVTSWQQVWSGRAKVDFSSGSQLVSNNETINTISKKVTIRTKPAFNEKLSNLRILIDGEYYRILAKDVRSRDMATIFTCELINE
jgi:SPP1 family predicted phage head-tail adaptor